MSDYNKNTYDFDNFDDSAPKPRHMKEDTDPNYGYADNFDFEDIPDDEHGNALDKSMYGKYKDNDDTDNSYGDDYYSNSDMFEADEKTKVFTPVDSDRYSQYNRNLSDKSGKKKKNTVIIVLCVLLAVVLIAMVIVFAVKFVSGSSDKPTVATTPASRAVAQTEQQIIETEPEYEPQDYTQEPEIVVTEEPYVEEETEYIEPTTEPEIIETQPEIIETDSDSGFEDDTQQ